MPEEIVPNQDEVKPWVEAELNRREFLKSVLGSFTPPETPDLKI